MRLDNRVAELCNCSRSRAAQLIKMNSVQVNGNTQDKLSYEVCESDNVKVLKEFAFASAGGYKLAKALAVTKTKIFGVCADIGASNGGFCDCLLQNGAEKVYAVDVGECALPDSLKNNAKIVIKDRLNARNLTLDDIGEFIDFATVDVSFISLKLVLKPLCDIGKDSLQIFALIKPQFEAGKKALSKKGIVLSIADRVKVVNDIIAFANSIGLYAHNICCAPIKAGKNIEYIIHLTKCVNNYTINTVDIPYLKEIEQL